MASRPSAPRTAKALPSAATSTSGCGDRIIMTTAQPIKNAPTNRNGVLSRQSTTRPRLHSSSEPPPNAATRPNAPGKLETQAATAIIHSMPWPIIRQQKPSRPSGMVTMPRMPHGITQAETIGIASRFPTTP